ncbi:MAG TPA: HAMP domain-containing sensor histidine kinase [Thermoanaerobaculia bacterium]|nr:HAMP domain-containing sensor histidine kinase [Thermoanaerobaculia bacterium]
MTLRLRLFALLVALASLLAVGEWMLVRALSVDLEEELATTAAAVSQDVLRLFHLGDDLTPPPLGASTGKPGQIERRIFVVEDHSIVRRDRGAAAVRAPEGTAARLPRDSTAIAAPTPLLTATQGPPGTHEASGIIERQTVGADGKVTTERHQVRARFEPGSAAHVVVFQGPKGAEAQRVPVPTSGVEHAIERFTRRLLLASLGLFGGALLLGVVVTHRFTRPLHDLAVAARRVGSGDLGVHAPAAPGEVGEAVAAFNQMSEQLAALDAEARRLRASEQLSELGEVGRGLAHSLRNPLNALGLALDQLAERAMAGDVTAAHEGTFRASGSADPHAGTAGDVTAIAAAARRQIRRIDAALRGFLALSATDAAAVDVDLVAVARDVALEALQTRPAGDGAPRVEVVAGAEPVRLRGVEAELRAALQALVVNAVEASPGGEPVVVTVVGSDRRRGEERSDEATSTIEIAAVAPRPRDDRPSLADVGGVDGTGSSVTITVDDNGSGVPPAVRERLFTPHVTTKAAGAGMGLYLAHRLATTRYGGALELADRAGGGTRATLTLANRRAANGAPSA